MDFIVDSDKSTATIKTNVDRLNAGNASELKAELVLLNKNGVNNIVIDMSKTKFCDSSGLSAVLVANRLCKDTGGRFAICGLQDNVKKLIEIAQLDKVLTITSSVDEAIHSIQQV